MIENDWGKIREMAFQLVWEHRENENTDLWQNNTGQDNESRIKVEINRMVNHIQNQDSPLNMYVGRVEDEILAKYISELITTPFKDRKFISKLGFKGMRYDYTDLLGKPDSAEKYTDSDEAEENKKRVLELYSQIDMFFDQEKIMDTILYLIEQIKENNESAVDAFEGIKECICLVNMQLKGEKILAACNDMESVYSVRVSSYAKLTESMVMEILYRISTKFSRYSQSKGWLKYILLGITQINDEVQKVYEKEIKKPFQELIINQEGKKSTPARDYITLGAQYKAYDNEATMIENLLESDIERNKEFFLNPRMVKYSQIQKYLDDLPLIKDLKEGKNVCEDDYKMLEKAKKVSSHLEKINNSDSTIMLRIIYRELFMNKVKLQDKGRKNYTANTIAKKIISGKEIEKREWIFIEKKIQRGAFRECQILSEYKYFNKINQIYRGMMVKIFAFSNDVRMYDEIRNIAIRVLNLMENIVRF